MVCPTHPKQSKVLVVNGIGIFNPLHGFRSIGLNDIKLSIVIVNYKSWRVLAQCLDSFKQYKPKVSHEIIVVDNDSQDGEFESFAQQYPAISFVKNSGNHGFANGCNLGASQAKGNFLLFLNPDTLLTNHTAIDDLFDFASQHAEVGITSCRRINAKGRPEREIAFNNPWLIVGWVRTLYKLLNQKNISHRFADDQTIWHPDWVAGSVILINTSLFNQIGGWDQDNFWMYYEDVDLCQRVKSHQKKVSLLRNVELKHVHGGASRRNPVTTAITKSEVVTSCHVYLQLHTQGINRILLHGFILLNTVFSQLAKTLLTLPVFWQVAFKANSLTLITTTKYYVNTLIRHTWKSTKL